MIALSIWQITTSRSHPAHLFDIVFVALIIAVAGRIMIHVRIGSSRHTQSLTDAPLVLGLMLLPGPWLVLSAAVGVALAKSIARIAPRRIAFNTGKDVIIVALASYVGSMLGLGIPFRATAAHVPGLLVVGILVIVVDEILAIPVVALANRRSVRDVFLSNGHLRIGIAVVRVTVAVVAGYLLRFDPRLAIATPLLALGLHLHYASRLQQRADRLAWQRLARIADDIGTAEESAVYPTAIIGAAELFSCDEVDLELRSDGDNVRLLRGNIGGITYDGPPNGLPRSTGGLVIRAALENHDGTESGHAGELRIRFHAQVPFAEREQYTLRALAATVGTAIRKASAVAEAARMATEQAHAATHDSLTGLANRRHLLEHSAILNAPGLVGVAILDLNQFKQINEVLGQTGGDRALREIANRLTGGASSDDLVARLGGDSFAALFTQVDSQADAIGRTRDLVATLAEPITLDGIRFEVGATAGVAIGPNPAAVDELLRRADVAMNQAKREGLTISVYARSRDTADIGRLALSADLGRAVAERQFTIAFQPIVDLSTGEVLSAEALARWNHPERGNLPPHRFLDAIERSGLLAAFTAQVLDDALAGARAWRTAGFPVPVAVNVSPRSLLDPNFPATIPVALAAHDLPPEALIIELTETLTLSQLEVVDDVLHALRDQGILLALDDFGTGFSSLAALARVPVHELKIDRTFVAAMSGTAEGAIVRSTIELGRGLDLLVVAEGIESEEQRERLWALGCPAGQGHLFARPITVEQLIEKLRRGHHGVPGRLAAPMRPSADVIRLPGPRRAIDDRRPATGV